MSEDIEHLRKKKQEDLQKKQDTEEKIKAALRSVLDESAYSRMMNVKVANPEVYAAAAQGCVSVYQRLNRRLGDREVLMILRRIKGAEKEPEIKFERK